MRASSKKEEQEPKKKYVFFFDPDVIVKRAESSIADAQFKQSLQDKQQDHRMGKHSEQFSTDTSQFNLKNLGSLFSYHPVQPYPFTFVTAVKRKFALDDTYEPHNKAKVNTSSAISTSKSRDRLYQTAKKMNFIKPLKVPDLKIAPKSLDYMRDNSALKESSIIQCDMLSKDLLQDKPEKPGKGFERVQRKLDFSASDDASMISENIEPLKTPNVSIAFNLQKKKEHTREYPREKENRSKRIKKDDVPCVRNDENIQDSYKKTKSPRHVSRREIESISSSASTPKMKNEHFLVHLPRESDFAITKQRTKNFVTSTTKKEVDRKYKSSNLQNLKVSRDCSESKSATCSNESISERSIRLLDKGAPRDVSRNICENVEHKYKDDFLMSKLGDDQSDKSVDSRQIKLQNKIQKKVQNKEQTRRVPEKLKIGREKIEGKYYIPNCEISEDMQASSDSNISLKNRNASSASTSQIKIKESNKQSIHSSKASRIMEDSQHSDSYGPQSSITNIKKVEDSLSQSAVSIKETDTNNDSNNLDESSFSEALLDPRRISFRDENRSQQEEFYDLVTPDVNLMLKSKRKKQSLLQNNDEVVDFKTSKYNTSTKTEMEPQGIQLLHPTALHMQFQAELHLLDSFNESIRHVMDVENCLYNVKQNQEMLYKQNQTTEDAKSHLPLVIPGGGVPKTEHCIDLQKTTDNFSGNNVPLDRQKDHASDEVYGIESYYLTNKKISPEPSKMSSKVAAKVAEVQTQTANDIATQTDIRYSRRDISQRFPDVSGITYKRDSFAENEIHALSLGSADQFEDLDQIEDMSLSNKMRTLSEISLHETTSSIKTETGTEISISTRDVTCSFNKYLDLEMAQLIKDEKQHYDKIEMLFKSREKTLNDRTKKLVKLEEQKRALRDTGQDSRISSVKKKQRALLLRLQQEKEEMNRLKELHKIASQERKLMLQKQRNMFNPQMSTKNILTKLKRSADSQSPRRLSGPMKGYDIRSNSSMSSLVDSDKSQHDRSQADIKLMISENDLRFEKPISVKSTQFASLPEESNTSLSRCDKSVDANETEVLRERNLCKLMKDDNKSKYDVKTRKFEEKMPTTDILRLKSHQFDMESKLIQGHSLNVAGQYCIEKQKSTDVSQSIQHDVIKSVSDYIKSESDTLVEELTKKSRSSQFIDRHLENSSILKGQTSATHLSSTESIQEQINCVIQSSLSKIVNSSQVSEDTLHTHTKNSKKTDKLVTVDEDISKKSQYNSDSRASSKRKNSKCQKIKSSSSILTEGILCSESSSQICEEISKHHNKRTKIEKEHSESDKNMEISEENIDQNESQSSVHALVKHSKAVKDKSCKLLNDITMDYESKENEIIKSISDKNYENYERISQYKSKGPQSIYNISTKSQISTLATSHHSSGDSEKSYSKSAVVVRSQDHDFKTSKKLEQILNAREAALASRKNCVEEWIAWHARLRAEEDRVTRMEQAAFKLVNATSNVLLNQERSICAFIDTTVSSDTSDVEGRIEMLTEKLAERRIEISRLKREARKQAKQRLRALEANLLNQIKKYDTKIHEMRKKLESKKDVIKDSERLAIESKSLADFKVPEIPLKKIQDIYSSSELLRSRSESDLLSTRNQQTDVTKNIHAPISVDKRVKHTGKKSAKSVSGRSTSTLLGQNLHKNDTNHSSQSIFEECIAEELESDKQGSSISSVSDDGYSEKYILYSTVNDNQSRSVSLGERQSGMSYGTVTGNVQTEAPIENDVLTSEAKPSTSQLSVPSDVLEYKSNNELATEQLPWKKLSLHSNIDQNAKPENSKSVSEKSKRYTETSITEVESAHSGSGLSIFSKKLDTLHLNNKNLHEDIYSLENELKTLSEMMYHVNKQSNRMLKTSAEEKSTSKDISEILSQTDVSSKANSHEIDEINKSKGTVLEALGESNSKGSTICSKDVSPPIIPEEVPLQSKLQSDIDYEARSKEILNEIEKSISEHIKVPEDNVSQTDSTLPKKKQYLYKGTEVSNDYTFLENDIKSVSEIIAKVAESKKNISIVAGNIYDDTHKLNTDIPEQTDVINVLEEADKLSLKQSRHSPLQYEQCMKISNEKSPVLSADVNYSQPGDNAIVTQCSLQNDISNVLSNITCNNSADYSNDTEHISSVSENENVSDLYVTEPIKEIEQSINSTSNANRSQSIQMKLKAQDSQILFNNAHVHSVCQRENSISFSNDMKNKSVSDSIANSSANDFHKDDLENNSFAQSHWTISDSFDVHYHSTDHRVVEEVENGQHKSDREDKEDSLSTFSEIKDASDCIENSDYDKSVENNTDVFAFIPNGESTKIENDDIQLENPGLFHSHVMKQNGEVVDTFDIVARQDNDEQVDKKQEKNVVKIEKGPQDSICDKNNKFNDAEIKDTDQRDSSQRIININDLKKENETAIIKGIVLGNPPFDEKLHDREISFNENSKCIFVSSDVNCNEPGSGVVGETSVININLHLEITNEDGVHRAAIDSQNVSITELEPVSKEFQGLPEIEIEAKVELTEEEYSDKLCSISTYKESNDYLQLEVNKMLPNTFVDIQDYLEIIPEHDSSDGEQLDNLVEIAESGLDTVEKFVLQSKKSSESETKNNEIATSDVEITGNIKNTQRSNKVVSHECIAADSNKKSFDILRDPEYEDISEESLEVSEILDKTECQKSVNSQKSTVLPEKCQIVQNSEEILRILDEHSKKSTESVNIPEKSSTIIDNATSAMQCDVGIRLENFSANVTANSRNEVCKNLVSATAEKDYEISPVKANECNLGLDKLNMTGMKAEDTSTNFTHHLPDIKDEHYIQINQLQDDTLQRQEQDESSDSSESGDTPRGVSEIEMDSPRDPNESRLDIDGLDDDLLADRKERENQQNIDIKADFRATSIDVTSEKDIEAMIVKLRASLEQPGLEVAELSAKLLAIEQLQIELQLKKLEAVEAVETVNYYVREIPNKPPPPYTPPGGKQRSTTLASPSLQPAVIPSNIEELTAFTEKATALIYKAKQSGEDIINIEASPEIYELTKDSNETAKKDKRIYNIFLFDLCKETAAEVYQAEYEKPGPSWTKPNVKTTPAIKIPKTEGELNEYVSKEIATLFGFKTKLQRENMVMRWSRKRRDRVDELLAREAQAEEDEWTKFHHDELAVKNDLTITILDTLLMDTTNVLKVAYSKKRRVIV